MKTRRVIVFLLSFAIIAGFVLFVLNWYPKHLADVPEPVATEPAIVPETEEKTETDTETETEAATESETEETTEQNTEGAKTPARLRITAVGDIMFHMPQITYAATGDGYDFSDSFALIAPYVQRADFSIGNFETTSNPEYDYSGYPQFNVPAQALDAIKAAGFDALSTANNHCLDTYESGIRSTLQAIRERDMLAFGTREEAGERVLLTEINGISIALLSYTYGFNGLEYTLTDEQYTDLVNPLDAEDIRADITRAKEMGAELVIVYPHWGVEYSRSPSEDQQILAHNMVNWGADLVLGSHPHVVQPQEWIDREDGSRAYIIYSMANFISGQRLEYNEDIHVEQSVLLDIEVSRNEKDIIDVESVDTIPLWVDRTDSGLFRTVATQDGLNDYAHLFADWKIDRIRQAEQDTTDILTLAGDSE